MLKKSIPFLVSKNPIFKNQKSIFWYKEIDFFSISSNQYYFLISKIKSKLMFLAIHLISSLKLIDSNKNALNTFYMCIDVNWVWN